MERTARAAGSGRDREGHLGRRGAPGVGGRVPRPHRRRAGAAGGLVVERRPPGARARLRAAPRGGRRRRAGGGRSGAGPSPQWRRRSAARAGRGGVGRRHRARRRSALGRRRRPSHPLARRRLGTGRGGLRADRRRRPPRADGAHALVVARLLLRPGTRRGAPGERKVVGISQRRTRRWARFQCAAYVRWDPAALVALLAGPRPSLGELADAVLEVPAPAADLRIAFESALPKG